VIAAFIAAAVSYLLRLAGWPSLFSLQPFYRPDTFRWPAVATATSLAALTYIGFDGVTTLAEEVKEPERTLPVATVLTCLITGVLSCVEVYLAQRVAGDRYIFDNPETAFLDMAGTAGGPALFGAMGLILIVSCFASGLTGQASAARLLYGMARSGLLPGKMFAQLDSATGSPNRNLWLLAAVTAAGTLVLDYETAAGLLNFGAFLAFLGVNAAAGYTLLKDDRNPRKWQALLCGIGFLFCLVIWLSLPAPGKIAGCVWLALGVVLLLARPRVLQLTRP
jgi:amino acid transporter